MDNPMDVSNRHVRGIWVLFFSSVFILLMPRILLFCEKEDDFYLTVYPINYKKAPFKKKDYFTKKYQSFDKKSQIIRKPTHFFDPNQLSQAEWVEFGLSTKQANVVMKILRRKVSSNEELSRIKYIPKNVFERIKDFTMYPSQAGNQTNNEVQGKAINPKFKVVFLNEANEEDLLKVPGIGPFFAKQILKYQHSLGGYYRKEQILEVWKMTQEKYDEFEKYMDVRTEAISHLSINNATLEELQAHPYISWNQANSIVKLRQQLGGFKNIEEIKKSIIISEEIFEKVRPYLSL